MIECISYFWCDELVSIMQVRGLYDLDAVSLDTTAAIRDHGKRRSESIGFHWDKDEDIAAAAHVNIHPKISTVRSIFFLLSTTSRVCTYVPLLDTL